MPYGLPSRGVVDVDPQDRAEPVARVLAGRQGVVGRTAVAERDVEVAVGAEGDRAAVVVAVGIGRPDPDPLLARRVGPPRIVAGDLEPRDDRAAAGRAFMRRVVDEELAVAPVVGMEGQAEQALLVVPAAGGAVDLGADVQELDLVGGARLVGERPDAAPLLDDEQPVAVVVGIGHGDGTLELEVREGDLGREPGHRGATAPFRVPPPGWPARSAVASGADAMPPDPGRAEPGGGAVRKARRSRIRASPSAPASPAGMTDVLPGRSSSISDRGMTVAWPFTSMHPDRVGPLGPDHAGGHAAVLQGDGVGEIFGIDHGAGLGDIAVDRRRVPIDQVVERRSRVAALAPDLVTARAPGLGAVEDGLAAAGVAARRREGDRGRRGHDRSRGRCPGYDLPAGGYRPLGRDRPRSGTRRGASRAFRPGRSGWSPPAPLARRSIPVPTRRDADRRCRSLIGADRNPEWPRGRRRTPARPSPSLSAARAGCGGSIGRAGTGARPIVHARPSRRRVARADEGSTWGHHPVEGGSAPFRPANPEDFDAAQVISQRDTPLGRGPSVGVVERHGHDIRRLARMRVGRQDERAAAVIEPGRGDPDPAHRCRPVADRPPCWPARRRGSTGRRGPARPPDRSIRRMPPGLPSDRPPRPP